MCPCVVVHRRTLLMSSSLLLRGEVPLCSDKSVGPWHRSKQVCTPVIFRTNNLKKSDNSLIPTKYRLNSTIIGVLQQGWIWHLITHEGWYAIEQRYCNCMQTHTYRRGEPRCPSYGIKLHQSNFGTLGIAEPTIRGHYSQFHSDTEQNYQQRFKLNITFPGMSCLSYLDGLWDWK